jgi:hypothetical protein
VEDRLAEAEEEEEMLGCWRRGGGESVDEQEGGWKMVEGDAAQSGKLGSTILTHPPTLPT